MNRKQAERTHRNQIMGHDDGENKQRVATSICSNRLSVVCLLEVVVIIASVFLGLWSCWWYLQGSAASAGYAMVIGIDEVCLVLCLILGSSVLLDSFNDVSGRSSYRLYLGLVMTVSVILCSENLCLIFEFQTVLVSHALVTNAICFAGTPALAILWWFYLRSEVTSVQSWWGLVTIFLLILCGLHGMVCVFDAFGASIFFSISPDGTFVREPLYWLSLVVAAVLLISTTFMIIGQRTLKLRQSIVLMGYLLLPLIAAAIQVVFPDLRLTYPVTALALAIVYANVLVERGREIDRNKLVAERQRSQAMLSQIQPHFLYNSLTAIMAIEGNPPTTLQALSEFSMYLRGNLDSLKDRELIPLSEELNHVRNYLSLEQLRFGDRVSVVYQIEAEEFEVPPLSVQMLVENAVKHGLTTKDDGGTVAIGTCDQGNCWQVTVQDDGVGFDVDALFDKDEVKSNRVGLANVVYRVRTVCGGTVKVESCPGRTLVCITIPKSANLLR